ncbi:MAG: DUF1801 domain-containing protein [Terriglobales bacterium]
MPGPHSGQLGVQKDELTMAKTGFKNVDEYIAAQPEAAQAVLGSMRSAIRRALPKAEEVISYKIPAYKLNGAVILYFAGWKQHYSLYPAGDRLVAAFKQELAPYKISKGTIRFPLDKPVPGKLIERIAKRRAAESAKRDREKLRSSYSSK